MLVELTSHVVVLILNLNLTLKTVKLAQNAIIFAKREHLTVP